MKNLKKNTEFIIQNDKLILDYTSRVEIPLIKILFIDFEDDVTDPVITIRLVDGTKVDMLVNSKVKQQIKDLINKGRGKIIGLELKKMQVEETSEKDNKKVIEEDFNAYKRVQNSGFTNMFDTKMVSKLSGLSRKKILDIIKNYSMYTKRWS